LKEFCRSGSFAGGAGEPIREPNEGFACLPGFGANLLFLVGIAVSFTRWKEITRPISICAAVCAVVSALAYYWTNIRYQFVSDIPFLGTAAWIAAMFLFAAAAKTIENDKSRGGRASSW
jgi:Kef-type K+ transport system membrane component KefB